MVNSNKNSVVLFFIIVSLIFLLSATCSSQKFTQENYIPTHLKAKIEEKGKQPTPSFIYNTSIIGFSVENRPIYLTEIGSGEEITLIFGVIHGDEPQGKYMIEKLKEYLISHPQILKNKKVLLIPVVNPDGLVRKTRTNARGVDLNRNFPTKDWGTIKQKKRYYPGKRTPEPETKIIISVLEKYKPHKVISIHSPHHCNNYDGPAKELALEMAKYNKYPVKGYIGYPTPGSFGTYAGKERNIPVVTLEVPNISGEEAWAQNKAALIAAIKFDISKEIKIPARPETTLEATPKKSQKIDFIKVVKSQQKLYTYKDGKLIKTYPVSTGFNNLPYNGSFKIISKQEQKCWKLINNQWVSYCKDKRLQELGPYFLVINSRHRKTKRYLGIHGTDREDLIGKPVSKGCVRMKNKDIEELYHSVPIGTRVEIID